MSSIFGAMSLQVQKRRVFFHFTIKTMFGE